MGSGYRMNFGKTKGAITLNSLKLDSVIVFQQVSEADKEIKTIAKKSPIRIPQSATYKKQEKIGYQQIKYKFINGNYEYEIRWHTQTPNAPKGTGSTYQVTRTKKGFGYGKEASIKRIEHLIKHPNGNKKWVSTDKYQEAIRNKKIGKATKKEMEMIKYGHIK